MKKATLTFISTFIIIGLWAQLGTGLPSLKESKGNLKEKDLSKMGFSSTIPTSFSVKNYTPYPKSQGSYSTCASWATAYSAMTTQYAMAMKMTNRNIITSLAFCPYFTHNNSKVVTDACSSGSGFYEITNQLIENGTKKFYLPLINCATANDHFMTDGAKNYRIKGAYAAYNYTGTNNEDEAGFNDFFKKTPFDLETVKKLLVNNIVPIFAAYLPPSFSTLTGEPLWELSSEEKSNPTKAQISNMSFQHSRHAMTIVSYDDNKYGGAFEIMNSWGPTFGNDGYIWVRYADLQKYVYQIIYVDFSPTPPTSTTGCVYGDCNNGYGIAKFDSGEMYEGFFSNGQYNGYGIYSWATGMTYDGSWKNGSRDGDATFYYADGSYGGVTYSNDQFVSGYSKLVYDNGGTYEGTLKNGEFEGYGKYTFSTGDSYEGSWVNGNYDGIGKFTFATGDVHVGYFTAGQYNGLGILFTAAGKVWGGTWSYDKWVSGKSYGFANSTKPNFIELVAGANVNYVDAACTTGDCLNGKGTRKYSSGIIYEGQFKDGLENGMGKQYYTDGGTLETFFKEGSYFGPAVYRSKNGSVQLGNLKGGTWDGYIVYIDASGSTIIGRYSEGKYIGDLASANVGEVISSKPSAATQSTFKQIQPRKLGK